MKDVKSTVLALSFQNTISLYLYEEVAILYVLPKTAYNEVANHIICETEAYKIHIRSFVSAKSHADVKKYDLISASYPYRTGI